MKVNFPSKQMRIKPCPNCNRLPVITECKQRNGVRRRLIKCPNYCSCLLPLHDIDDDRVEKPPWSDQWINSAMLVFLGDGDYNAIYKVWNKSIVEQTR